MGRKLAAALVVMAVVLGVATPALAATGPDVASWQHPGDAPIHWPSVAESGQSFVFIKADEGPWGSVRLPKNEYYINPYFESDWAAAGAAGLIRGTYHYARPRLPVDTAVDDARHFVATAGTLRAPGLLPHVLDLEEHGDLAPRDLVTWTRLFLQEVERLSGRPPMIYTGQYFWQQHMGDTTAFSDYRLWVASWYDNLNPSPRLSPPRDSQGNPVSPVLFGGWTTWTFWQYTADARVPGVNGQIDMNTYCCSDTNLRALADGSSSSESAGNPFGGVDGVHRLPSGHNLVSGWAIDPDTTGPIDVHLYAGSTFLGGARADRPHPEVGDRYPGWGDDHGFEAMVLPPPGAREICVLALNDGPGSGHPPLGCVPVDGAPFGMLDRVEGLDGAVRLQGWAMDPDEAGPIQVQVTVDGRHSGDWLADAHRPDVGAGYPGFGDDHGFDVVINGVGTGSREVCATAVGPLPGPANAELGCVKVDVEPGPPGYWDVPPGHQFLEDITWLAEAAIAEGYADGTYQPTWPVTRQAMAAFLQRLVEGQGIEPEHEAEAEAEAETEVAGATTPAARATATTFADVAPDHPFYDAITWLAASGVAEGYADGTFRPDEPVSRQAMAAFLARLDVLVGGAPGGGAVFTDVPADHAFALEIGWLGASGVAEGYPDGTFRPVDAVSRQAMAAFLHRFDDRVPGAR